MDSSYQSVLLNNRASGKNQFSISMSKETILNVQSLKKQRIKPKMVQIFKMYHNATNIAADLAFFFALIFNIPVQVWRLKSVAVQCVFLDGSENGFAKLLLSSAPFLLDGFLIIGSIHGVSYSGSVFFFYHNK